MARPARYNADYYTHTADLRNDRRVKAIRTKFGAAGYGLFHMLLEALTDADHTALDTSALELELLAGDFGVEASEIEAVLKFGEAVGYFGRNDAGLLICAELSKWLEPVFEKRNRSKNPPAAAFPSQPAAETGVSVTETPQSKVKESKGEKSKEHTPSSFQSEGDAPPKKIEDVADIVVGDTNPESPTPGSAHQGGAADVGTSFEVGQNGQNGQNRGQKDKKPTEAEVLDYLTSQRPHNPPAALTQLAAKWHAHYSANGWRVGKNPMKDWQAACRTWLVDVPKLEPGQQSTIQAHAIHRSSPGYGANAAAARLQTPTPDASSPNAWGLPAYTPPASVAGHGGGN